MKRDLVFLLSIFTFIFNSVVYAAHIEPDLAAALQSLGRKEMADAIILMKEQAEVPSHLSRPQKIQYIKDLAERTQAPLIEYLEEQKLAGKVERYNSLWLVNSIAFKADPAVIEEVAQWPQVDKLTLNHRCTIPDLPTPADASLFSVRPLNGVQSNITQIKANDVWLQYSVSGEGVVVGIVDSGVMADHPDLAGKVKYFIHYNPSGQKVSGETDGDAIGHGTHVAGTIAGGSASGTSIGVAPGAKLAVARVFETSKTTSGDLIIKGMQWTADPDENTATDNPVDVLNMSIGNDTPGADTTYVPAINNLYALGIILVGAIGNWNTATHGPTPPSSTTSPANHPKVIGVGAVDSLNALADFSCQGPVTWEGVTYIKPDLVAPGVSIKSSYKGGGYAFDNGTSMASPHVAGVVALMLSVSREVTVAEVFEALDDTSSTDLVAPGKDNFFGWGLVNALKAVEAVATPDIILPQIVHTPVLSGTYKQPISLQATATDDRTRYPTTSIYYRRRGQSTWSTAQMSNSASVYSGTIPATETIENIEYYIQAKDIALNSSVAPAGAPANYYTVSIASLETLDVSSPLAYVNLSSTTTVVAFSTYLSEDAVINISVYDLTGTRIKYLSQAGSFTYNEIPWDGITDFGESIANGVYIYLMEVRSGTSREVKKGKFAVFR